MSHCEHCQFFSIIIKQGPLPGDRLIGHCHRYPPTAGKPTPLVGEMTTADLSHFPLVKATDWCGEFQRASTGYRRMSVYEDKAKCATEDRRLLVSAQEAAKMLDISHGTLCKLTSQGQVPAVRIGSRVCYRIETLRNWIAASERTGGGAGKGGGNAP